LGTVPGRKKKRPVTKWVLRRGDAALGSHVADHIEREKIAKKRMPRKGGGGGGGVQAAGKRGGGAFFFAGKNMLEGGKKNPAESRPPQKVKNLTVFLPEWKKEALIAA